MFVIISLSLPMVPNLIIKNWKQDFVGCVNMNLNLSLAVHFF
jgi:hypothetical protein